jgi:hypothetical protein
MTGAPDSADDSGSGLTMFVVFAAAILISTGVVCLIGLVEAWWALGLGFAAHVAVTAIVVLEIAHVLSGQPDAYGLSGGSRDVRG